VDFFQELLKQINLRFPEIGGTRPHTVIVQPGQSDEEALQNYKKEHPLVDDSSLIILVQRFSKPGESWKQYGVVDPKPSKASINSQESSYKHPVKPTSKVKPSPRSEPGPVKEPPEPVHRLHRVLDRIDGLVDDSEEKRKVDKLLSFRRRNPTPWDWMR
jgi:hypothetical protein